MNSTKRTTLAAYAVLVAAISLLSGCNETTGDSHATNNGSSGSTNGAGASHSDALLSGTAISVSLGSNITSATASVGDAWHGVTTTNVSMQGGGVISAGSAVEGIIAGVTPAKRGSRAMLQLGVRSIHVGGETEKIAASSEPVIAGSTRARNLGGIAAGAAAGALIGKAVGDGKNAAAGGLIGAAAATGVVASSSGYQVVLSNGTVMQFTVDQTVAMR